MTTDNPKGWAPVPTLGGDQQRNEIRDEIRDAFRAALAQFIDPDDDTMPALNHVHGGFTWLPADEVLDQLAAAVDPLLGKLGKIREHVNDGQPPTGAIYEWDYGYEAALHAIGEILDNKEPAP